MVKLKHRGKYYLKKIKAGEMTRQQVADSLCVSIDDVNSAYDNYTRENSPIKTMSYEKKKNIVQIAISIISTIIILLTLNEMQAARDAAYLPNLVLTDLNVSIEWKDIGKHPNEQTEELQYPSIIYDSNTYLKNVPKLKIHNIGVGTAKDIILNWNMEKNINELIRVFDSFEDIDIACNWKEVTISVSGRKIQIGIPETERIEFLMNSTQGYCERTVPLPFYYLFNLAYVRNVGNRIPPIALTVSYSDIQGKRYQKEISLISQRILLSQDPDGSGECMYSLSARVEEQTMNLFGIYLNGENVKAITSVCTVLISLLALGVSIYSGYSQRKHNKNSVRPIPAIKLKDFRGPIKVSIQNVGTGPLIIKRLSYRYNGQENSDFKELMKDYLKPGDSVISNEVGNWTIGVGNELILIYMKSIGEKKEEIKAKLSNIEVELNYTDVYNSKFATEKRKLNWFERIS